MQRSVPILLGIFLSALIVYGGSGVNIYFYCCGDCRVEGPVAVVEHKCCEIHHRHHNGCTVTLDENHECDQFVNEFHGECGVDRTQFCWQSSQRSQVQLQPTFINLNNTFFSCTGCDITTLEGFFPVLYRKGQSQTPPDLSKEDYFSLLTTLII